MKQKILFVDMDGVINPMINIRIQKEQGNPTSANYILLPGDKIYKLRQICERTGCMLIMSSSWRIGACKGSPSPAYMNANNQLMRYGIRFSGWTPLHPERIRGIEINWYLETFEKQFGYRPNYVILDDERHDIMGYGHKGHMVQTNSMIGLQDNHVNIAVNLLNKGV